MKRINVGVMETPKKAKVNHASVTLDAVAGALLAQWVEVNPRYKDLKNQTETLSKQLAPLIKESYWARFAGVAPESSTMLAECDGKTVKLIVKDAYSKMLKDEKPIVAAIGQELTDANFRFATLLKVDFDKVPEEHQEEFAKGVVALAAQYGCGDAVTQTDCIQPKAGFHEARTSLLTPEQNKALDRVLSVTAYPLL